MHVAPVCPPVTARCRRVSTCPDRPTSAADRRPAAGSVISLQGDHRSPSRRNSVPVVVRTRRRTISLLTLIWLIIGVVVALQRGYITVSLLKAIVSAILAVVLWPLVLLGISFH